MSNSAKVVLWMGFFMIAFGVVKNWSAISSTIFGSNNSALQVPGPGGIPTLNGKCPGPNYYMYKGKCYSSAVNLPPAGPITTGATT
jgi:hypothetical protein